MFSNVLQKYNKITKYQKERVVFSPKTYFFLQKTRIYGVSFPPFNYFYYLCHVLELTFQHPKVKK